MQTPPQPPAHLNGYPSYRAPTQPQQPPIMNVPPQPPVHGHTTINGSGTYPHPHPYPVQDGYGVSVPARPPTLPYGYQNPPAASVTPSNIPMPPTAQQQPQPVPQPVKQFSSYPPRPPLAQQVVPPNSQPIEAAPAQFNSMPYPPQQYPTQSRPTGTNISANEAYGATMAPIGTSNMVRPGVIPPPIATMARNEQSIDQLTGQVQGLMVSRPSISGSTISDGVVGIIGTPLPLDLLHGSNAATSHSIPRSPIQPSVDPAFARVTLLKVPRTNATLQKTKIPFGITITPYPPVMAASQKAPNVPVIDGTIVRCRRCRTYLNPYVQILDQGMKWKCNMCYLDNEFPSSFDYDPIAQKYIDRNSKVELIHSVYEFIAPMEYMVRPPQPPVYLFILDVSYGAIATGVVANATRIISSCLDSIPDAQGRTRVALMTVDSAIHFYTMNLTRPSANGSGDCRMLVVADVDDPILPCPDDLLVSLSPEAEGGGRALFERTLKTASMLFNSTQNSNNALGPALSAAMKLLAPIGGKIVVFQASLPNVGEGKLVKREDPKVLGTTKENALLQPATTFYKTLATEFQRHQVCVDVFGFNPGNQFLDLATIGCVAKYTGGAIHYYDRWDAANVEMVETFASDLATLITTETGLEAVIRIRASQGLNLCNYHGSFFLRAADLLSLPNVNQSHSYSAQITIDENLTGQLACFQTAVLHTTCNGERRIRVINSAYSVTDDAKEVFMNADVGALGDLLLKMACEKVLQNRLEDAREALQNKMLDVLTAIKNLYQTGKNPQLLVPDSLRLLPLLILGIIKSLPIRAGPSTSLDLRSYYLSLAKTLSVQQSLLLIHPFLFAIHLMSPECGLPRTNNVNNEDQASTINREEEEEIVLPPALHLSSENLERHGLYVLYTEGHVYLWVGSQIHPELCQLIFGQPFNLLANGPTSLPRLDNAWNGRILNILETLRKKTGHHATLHVIREDADPIIRSLFLQHLIEDRGSDNQPSYVVYAGTLRDKIYST